MKLGMPSKLMLMPLLLHVLLLLVWEEKQANALQQRFVLTFVNASIAYEAGQFEPMPNTMKVKQYGRRLVLGVSAHHALEEDVANTTSFEANNMTATLTGNIAVDWPHVFREFYGNEVESVEEDLLVGVSEVWTQEFANESYNITEEDSFGDGLLNTNLTLEQEVDSEWDSGWELGPREVKPQQEEHINESYYGVSEAKLSDGFGTMTAALEWQFDEKEAYGMQVQRLWLTSNGSSEMRVAVLDSGLIGLSRQKQWFANAEEGYDFVSDLGYSLDGDGRDANAEDPGDAGPQCPSPSWHGTKMAFAMAGRHHIIEGLHSVAWNTTIQPLRVLGLCSVGFANDVTDAIVWAAGGLINGLGVNPKPAKIISMSFGGRGACPSFLQSAISMAIREFGAIVLAAAGNQGSNVKDYFPANCQGVIAVAASTAQGFLARYSNRGPLVKIAAPGGDSQQAIQTLDIKPDFSVAVGRSWGTSFSTSFAAGFLALALGIEPRMSLTWIWDKFRVAFSGLDLDTLTECISNANCGAGILSTAKAETEELFVPTPQDNSSVNFTETEASWETQNLRVEAQTCSTTACASITHGGTPNQNPTTITGSTRRYFRFTVTSGFYSPIGPNYITFDRDTMARVLVVAGGGAGGQRHGGGGGAGAMIQNPSVLFKGGTVYTIVVGEGGGPIAARTASLVSINRVGYPSSITSGYGTMFHASYGGGGACNDNNNGGPGGSSGGGTVPSKSGGTVHETQNWPSGIYGNSGGNGLSIGSPCDSTAKCYCGAGGGGSSSSGTSGTQSSSGCRGGDGGNGTINDITGSNVTYAAGGGGGTTSTAIAAGKGGSSGVGGAGSRGNTAATNAAAGTGSGGGGSGYTSGSNYNAASGGGGSGVVIIQWECPIGYLWTGESCQLCPSWAPVDALTGACNLCAGGSCSVSKLRRFPPKAYDSITSEISTTFSGVAAYNRNMTLTQDNILYGAGTYSIYYSCLWGGAHSLNMFIVFNFADNGGNTGGACQSILYNTTTGIYYGTKYLADVNSKGEWIAIQVPNSIIMKRYTIVMRSAGPLRAPLSFTIHGSNNGQTWTLLDNITSAVYTDSRFSSILNNDQAFSFFSMTVHQLPEGTDNVINFNQWILYDESGDSICANGTYAATSDSTACTACPIGTFSPSVNLAKTCGPLNNSFCTAAMNAQYGSHIAQYGNDGLFSTYFHTTCNWEIMWWSLDFEYSRNFRGGRIWNRIDSLARLNNYQIWIGENQTIFNGVGNSRCFTSTSDMHYLPPFYDTNFTCIGQGRYLYVHVPSNGGVCLHFREIEVYPLLNFTACPGCAPGTFSGELGARACKACSPNSMSPASSTDITNCTCNPGFSGADGGTCTICAASSYKGLQGSSPCLACELGFYAAIAGMSACSQCESGTYASATGVSSCLSCTGSCSTSQYEDPPCNPVSNRACSSCPSGAARCTTSQRVIVEPYQGLIDFSVPENVKSVQVKMWGGGGGSKQESSSTTFWRNLNTGNGGAGGYAECVLSVNTGMVLRMSAGRGGNSGLWSDNIITNESGTYNWHNNPAQGGGKSELFSNNDRWMAVGGGGGGGAARFSAGAFCYLTSSTDTSHGGSGGGNGNGTVCSGTSFYSYNGGTCTYTGNGRGVAGVSSGSCANGSAPVHDWWFFSSGGGDGCNAGSGSQGYDVVAVSCGGGGAGFINTSVCSSMLASTQVQNNRTGLSSAKAPRGYSAPGEGGNKAGTNSTLRGNDGLVYLQYCTEDFIAINHDTTGSISCLCKPGKFHVGTTCINCSPGSYSSVNGASACIACPAGNYSNAQGLSTCLTCPNNSSSASTNGVSCVCNAGYYNSFSLSKTCGAQRNTYCNATQSQTHEFHAQLGNDGDFNTFQLVMDGPDRWWRIDLEYQRNITGGMIWNRQDFNSYKLNGYKIWIGNNRTVFNATGNIQCFTANTTEHNVPPNFVSYFTCIGAAQYLYVHTNNDHHLHFAEINIYSDSDPLICNPIVDSYTCLATTCASISHNSTVGQKPTQITGSVRRYYRFISTNGNNTIMFEKNTLARVLVVGGGGGGGQRHAGGGGAGAMIQSQSTLFLANILYSITVGAGGAGRAAGIHENSGTGNDGSPSQIMNYDTVLFKAMGGGAGAQGTGKSGGSGGGGGPETGITNSTVVNTNIPPGMYGNVGNCADWPTINSCGGAAKCYVGGGGGGMGSAGKRGIVPSSSGGIAGNGGDGLSDYITGTWVTYAAGGGGGSSHDSQSAGTGGSAGIGGAGIKGNPTATSSNNGQANTGSGGGGGGFNDGAGYPAGNSASGSGADGVVIVQWGCPMGYAWDGTKCYMCPIGMWADSETSTCNLCPGNSSTQEAGSNACTCNPGYTGSNASVCTICGAGTYKSVQDSSPCLSCPINTYSPVDGAKTCLPCPNGTSSAAGSSMCMCSAAGTVPLPKMEPTLQSQNAITYTDVPGYYVHQFKNVGSSAVVFTQDTIADVLVVGGGGGGGCDQGGGGGAGAVLYYSGYKFASGTYSFEVGAGGLQSTSCLRGSNGQDSSISNVFVAKGGGGGPKYVVSCAPVGNGGSGAGASTSNTASACSSGTAVNTNTIDSLSGYTLGNPGGSGSSSSACCGTNNSNTGGGGGAGTAGQNANTVAGRPGVGGNGISLVNWGGMSLSLSFLFGQAYTNIAVLESDSQYYIAGGGGGGGVNTGDAYMILGGKGGGGFGRDDSISLPTTSRQGGNGRDNTGSGGGGNGQDGSLMNTAGGSGLILIRYNICQPCAAGSFSSASSSTTCQKCNAGQYSGPAAAACQTCPQNSVPQTGAQDKCLARAGYYPAHALAGPLNSEVLNLARSCTPTAQCTVSSKSVYGNDVEKYSPTYANDGNYQISHPQTFVSKTGPDEWFRVDLGSSKAIAGGKLAIRNDCCQSVMDNFNIWVGNTNSYNGAGNVNCYSHSGIAHRSFPFQVMFSCAATGQYVFVHNPGSSLYITINEIEVYPLISASVNSGQLLILNNDFVNESFWGLSGSVTVAFPQHQHPTALIASRPGIASISDIDYPVVTDDQGFVVRPHVWYKFDSSGCTTDSSGNGFTLTHNSTNSGTMATCSNTVVKRGDLSASFLASSKQHFKWTTDQGVAMNLPNIQTTQGITFSLWGIMLSSSESHAIFLDFSVFGTSYTAASATYFSILRSSSNPYLRFLGRSTDIAITTFNIVYGNWYHIAWSVSATGSWTVYIDNIKYICPTCSINATVNMPSKSDSEVYGYSIGRSDQTGGRNYLSGNVDDLRIYKGVLTDAQVNILYQGRAGVYNASFQSCPANMYSPADGATACFTCPSNSSSVSTNGVSCVCNAGYYNSLNLGKTCGAPGDAYCTTMISRLWSTSSIYAASQSNDGSLTTFGIVFEDPNEWWRMDFEYSRSVAGGKIWNRRDCCLDRLDGYSVWIGDNATYNGIGNINCFTATTLDHRTAPDYASLFVCVGTGRYLFVKASRAVNLHFAEIDVYSASSDPICTPCQQGWWCPNGIRSSCDLQAYSPQFSTHSSNCTCKSGYSGADGGTCTICGIGLYKSLQGSSPCLNCPAGNYSNAQGVSFCMGCATGTYNKLERQRACVSCAIGSFASAVGMSACLQCESGKYASAIGASSCLSCMGSCNSTQYADPPCNPGSNLKCSTCPFGVACRKADSVAVNSIVNWTVPLNVNSVNVRMWGAGGGAKQIDRPDTSVWGFTGAGGAGGFAECSLSVLPSYTLSLKLGGFGIGRRNVEDWSSMPTGGSKTEVFWASASPIRWMTVGGGGGGGATRTSGGLCYIVYFYGINGGSGGGGSQNGTTCQGVWLTKSDTTPCSGYAGHNGSGAPGIANELCSVETAPNAPRGSAQGGDGCNSGDGRYSALPNNALMSCGGGGAGFVNSAVCQSPDFATSPQDTRDAPRQNKLPFGLTYANVGQGGLNIRLDANSELLDGQRGLVYIQHCASNETAFADPLTQTLACSPLSDGVTSISKLRRFPPKVYDSITSEISTTFSGVPAYNRNITLTQDNILYGAGTYEIHYSCITSIGSGNNFFIIFDYYDNDGSANNKPGVHCQASYNTTTGNYLGSRYISNTNLKGEWVAIRTPLAIVLKRCTVVRRNNERLRVPVNFSIHGSKDGIIWTLLDNIPSATYSNNRFTTSLNNIESYEYFAMTVHTIEAGSAGFVNFMQWILYDESGNSICTNGTYQAQNDSIGCTKCPKGTFSASVNLARTCGPAQNQNCLITASSYTSHSPIQRVNDGDLFLAAARTNWDNEPWIRIDFEIERQIRGGRIWSANGDRFLDIKIWIGANESAFDGVGNINCFTMRDQVYAPLFDLNFTCVNKGRYLYIHRVYSASMQYIVIYEIEVYPLLNTTACTNCAPGYHEAWEGATACDLCTAGSYASAEAMTQCLNCALGTFSSSLGTVNCSSCSPNSMSPASSTNILNCTCNPGFSGADGGTCTICAAGSYKGLQGSSPCLACGLGLYAAIAGMSACWQCESGTYSSVNGASACTACPAGNYSNARGLSACLTCPSGTFSVSGSSMCMCSAAGTVPPPRMEPTLQSQNATLFADMPGYYVHQFKSVGSSAVVFTQDTIADVLVVGGGGGGGSNVGGGGGAGAVLYYSGYTFLANENYDVVVGGGGSSTPLFPGSNGDDSLIKDTRILFHAKGGGGGGAFNLTTCTSSMSKGSPGGSGGGGSSCQLGAVAADLVGGNYLNTNVISIINGFSLGNVGGTGQMQNGAWKFANGGGGGGAFSPGNPSIGEVPGSGGDGVYKMGFSVNIQALHNLFGNSYASVAKLESDGNFYVAGGGGGGGHSQFGISSVVPGGKGGGGAGQDNLVVINGENGRPNAGSGGGGGSANGGVGGTGGSGLILIRYSICQPCAAGFFAVNDNSTGPRCEACNASQFSGPGSAVCQACPSNGVGNAPARDKCVARPGSYAVYAQAGQYAVTSQSIILSPNQVFAFNNDLSSSVFWGLSSSITLNLDFGYPIIAAVGGILVQPYVWLKFDQDNCLADSSGNGFTLTFSTVNSGTIATCSSASMKRGSSSAKFVSSLINNFRWTAAQADTLNLPQKQRDTGISIATWARIQSTAYSWDRIYDFVVTSSDDGVVRLAGFLLTKVDTTNDVCFFCHTAGGAGCKYTASGLVDGNWHHYVISIAANGDWTVWVDGIKKMCPTCGSGNTNTNNLDMKNSSQFYVYRFGSVNGGYSNFDGNIDDFRIYRCVLTDPQVSNLYGEGAGLGYHPSVAIASPQAGPAIADNDYPIVTDSQGQLVQPLVWYKFDRDNCMADSSGNDFTLTFNTAGSGTAATCTNTKLKRGSSAGNFIASLKQNFAISNSLAITMDLPNIQRTTGITFSCWAILTSLSPSWARIFDFSVYSTDGSIQWFLIYRPNSLKISFLSATKSYTSSVDLVDEKWHHYVWSISNLGNWTIWIDNSKVSTSITDNMPVRTGNQTYQYYLGRSSNIGPTDWLDGSIDDFRIYRGVLTDAQVTTLYQGRAAVYNVSFQQCSSNSYSSAQGATTCLTCPGNSSSVSTNGAYCMCNTGYYNSFSLSKTCGAQRNAYCNATQSQTHKIHAQLGNDGDFNTFQLVIDGPDRWWRIDLEYQRSIIGGVIWNRQDFNSYKLDGYKIWIGNNGATYNASGNINCFTATTTEHTVPPHYVSYFTCVGTAQYLYVHTNNDHHLHFAEINIYSDSDPLICKPIADSYTCLATTCASISHNSTAGQKPTQITGSVRRYYRFISTTGTNTIMFEKNTLARVLVVGGGGGGGKRHSGAGGAGAMIQSPSTLFLANRLYIINVGTGGAGKPAGVIHEDGNDGMFSQISDETNNTLFKAIGGGGGRPDIYVNGRPGGCGGGAGPNATGGIALSINIPSLVFGNDGGGADYLTNGCTGTKCYVGGGGGGRGTAGKHGSIPSSSGGIAGNGGDGLSDDITGTWVTYAAGGGGGAAYNAISAGQGGSNGVGGAGIKGNPNATSVNDGQANTGSGGGGGGFGADNSNSASGAGGSGVVIIQWACPVGYAWDGAKCYMCPIVVGADSETSTCNLCPGNSSSALTNGAACVCNAGFYNSFDLGKTCGPQGNAYCSASQSQTYMAASLSNDGNLNTYGYVSDGTDKWWRIDFEYQRSIIGGLIWNRRDSNSVKLNGYKIWIGNNGATYNASGNINCFTATTTEHTVPPHYVSSFTCVGTAQYLYVHTDNNRNLHFSEIDIHSGSDPPTCVPCLEGMWCSNNFVNACPLNGNSPQSSVNITNCSCNPGYTGSNGGTCTACSRLGMYKSVQGSSPCLNCPPGNVSWADASTSCAACAAGSYNRLSQQQTCIQCPIGMFGNTSGMSACLLCESGKYASAIGASSCLSCTGSCNSTQYADPPCNVGSNLKCSTCPFGVACRKAESVIVDSTLSWTVPTNVNSINVRLWGAGGGAKQHSRPYDGFWAYTGAGGAGGFAECTLSVLPSFVLRLSLGNAGVGGYYLPNIWNVMPTGGSKTELLWMSSSQIRWMTVGGGGGGGATRNTGGGDCWIRNFYDISGGSGGGGSQNGATCQGVWLSKNADINLPCSGYAGFNGTGVPGTTNELCSVPTAPNAPGGSAKGGDGCNSGDGRYSGLPNGALMSCGGGGAGFVNSAVCQSPDFATSPQDTRDAPRQNKLPFGLTHANAGSGGLNVGINENWELLDGQRGLIYIQYCTSNEIAFADPVTQTLACYQCPGNSSSASTNGAACVCNAGFYNSFSLSKTCGAQGNAYCIASQNSDFAPAQRSNDGNLNSYGYSTDGPDRWWRLNLEYQRSITGGRIWNRRDQESYKLAGYKIWIGNNGTVFDAIGNINCFTATTTEHTVAPNYASVFTCVGTAQYLYVHTNNGHFLHFSEIDIYSGSNPPVCEPCPQGWWCSNNLRNMCPFNSNSPPNSNIVTNCSCNPGFSGADGDTCTACSRLGMYKSVQGSSPCLNCPPGSISWADASASCAACTAGYYNRLSKQQSCIQCPIGTFANTSGMSACLLCESGKYASAIGASSCLSCTGSCNSTQYADPPCNSGSNLKCSTCPFGVACRKAESVIVDSTLNWTVPSNVNSINVRLWGAGGGAKQHSRPYDGFHQYTGSGGAGGFAECTLQTSPSAQLRMTTGAGGTGAYFTYVWDWTTINGGGGGGAKTEFLNIDLNKRWMTVGGGGGGGNARTSGCNIDTFWSLNGGNGAGGSQSGTTCRGVIFVSGTGVIPCISGYTANGSGIPGTTSQTCSSPTAPGAPTASARGGDGCNSGNGVAGITAYSTAQVSCGGGGAGFVDSTVCVSPDFATSPQDTRDAPRQNKLPFGLIYANAGQGGLNAYSHENWELLDGQRGLIYIQYCASNETGIVDAVTQTLACSPLSDGVTSISKLRRFPPKAYDSITSEISTTFSGVPAYNRNITLTQDNVLYGAGTYAIYYSCVWGGGHRLNMFSIFNFADHGGNEGGHCQFPLYNTTTGIYYGTKYLANVNSKGEWIAIQVPNSIIIKRYTIVMRSANPLNMPFSFSIHGSNDGQTWTLLDNITSAVYSNNRFSSILNNNQAFSFYSMTVHQLPAGTNNVINFNQWILYDESGNSICTNGTYASDSAACAKCAKGTFTPSVNLAKTCGPLNNSFCTAAMSSRHNTINPLFFEQSGNDGLLSTYFHTKCNPEIMWWSLDFEYSRNFRGGRIWNRADSNSWKFNNYQVWVGNNQTIFNGEGNLRCFTSTSDIHNYPPDYDTNFTCIGQGRYLFVHVPLGGAVCLHFREIEVYPLLNTTTCAGCAPGYHEAWEGATACDICSAGTFSPTASSTTCSACSASCDQVVHSACTSQGRAVDTQCACNAGFYLANPNAPIKCSPCPANTYSVANSSATTIQACLCNPGFTCAYTKTITGTLRLSISLAAFTLTVQQNLIEAIARAAGVDPSRVTITKITPVYGGGGGRRLFSSSSLENDDIKKEKEELLEVVVVVLEPRHSRHALKIGAFTPQDQLKHRVPTHKKITIVKETWRDDIQLDVVKKTSGIF